jgi:3-phosphoshikimate 1-carboxyvinyltransferase
VPVDEIRSSGATLRAVRIRPAVPDAGGEREIEPDASSALYWAAAAVLVPGSAVTLTGLPERSRQPDMLAIRHLASMGAVLEAAPGGMRVHAAGGDADAAARLRPIVADCAACPDGALMLIAAAAAADGTSRVVGLGTLKAKESDRIAAMAEGLRAVGARATFGVDWIEIDPIPRGHRVDAVIDPHGDHRIAMSFAILGLRTGGIRVANPGCVAKSYPGFWDELDRTSRAHLRPFA